MDNRLGSFLRRACLAAAGLAALAVLPAVAGADRIQLRAHARIGGPGLTTRYNMRPDFYPYYYPYCPHQYWFFLYGVPPPTWTGCGLPVVVATAPEPELARLGLGVFGGSVEVEENDAGTDLGLVARLRLSRHFQLEAELSRTDIGDGARVDKRIGGALLLQLLPDSALSPYLLGGGGFGRAELDDGNLTANQAYGEIGVGLEWALAPHFSLFGDLRAGLRRSDTTEDRRALLVRDRGKGAGVDDDERFTRARIGALLYF